eukprot:g15250.t1
MESIGITVQTDGSVLVQGGYVHSVDKKGHMRRLEQKKSLGLVGLEETKQNTNNFTANSTLRDKFAANTRSASYKKMGEVVVLEGALEWEKPLRNTKIAWEKIKEDLRKEFGITTPQHLFQLPKAKLQELLKLLECKKAWEENKEHLRKEFGITTPQQLFQQLPKAKLQELLECKPKLDDRDVKRLLELQEEYHKSWVLKRQPGMTYKYLEDPIPMGRWRGERFAPTRRQEIAQEIAEAMIDRWDLIAQVKGVLDNDFKLPAALEQFWPRIRRKDQPGMKNLKKENGDIEKYEQIRQFFYYHETNGNSMTHCSLRGSTDTFTDTGKWFFPDPWMSMLGLRHPG